MKISIISLFLIALLGIIVSASIAQQNQNVPKTGSEVEALKIQRQTLENEKIGLETKLTEAKAKHAEAHAKLIDTEFDKLKGELRESNNDWLRAWSGWFLTIIGIFAAILLGVSYVFWFWLKSKTDKLIANEVEKSINRFKEAVEQVNILEDRLKILQKEQAAFILESSMNTYYDRSTYPQSIEVLEEETLLRIFSDEKYRLPIRHKAAEVLADKQSEQLVSPALKLLNSVVGLELEGGKDYWYCDLPNFIAKTSTQDAYQGLKTFLNRLLSENLKRKDWFLTQTVFSLAHLGIELKIKDSVDMMREVIPDLKKIEQYEIEIITLAEYFDKFQEPEGIRQILEHPEADEMPAVKTKCLELLKKYNSTNTKSEDIS